MVTSLSNIRRETTCSVRDANGVDKGRGQRAQSLPIPQTRHIAHIQTALNLPISSIDFQENN